MIWERLEELARELGLQGIGVAPAIDEVTAVFPWARSVVSCAVSYLPPETNVSNSVILNPSASLRTGSVKNLDPQKEILRDAQNDADDVPRGLVARFARGADYHTVVREKLSRLAQSLSGRTEICVDTTPIPERKLAVLAGIAWRGWNGNVFVEGCGSWVALGEIVTDLDLPPAKPLAIDRCTDCGLCMRHCPTRAITAPYVVDRARCLSHLTQAPGAIPIELRPKLGNRVHGCDICQEVCPRNAGVKPVTPEFAESRFPGAHPELIPLIELTSDEFRRRVRDSSIGWIRRARIRRNAAVAAGNLRCKQAVPALEKMLQDPDPVLRSHAAWALGRLTSLIRSGSG
jgi:epoxyqueuosine reductase